MNSKRIANSAVGGRIREVRKQHGSSLRSVAKALRISGATLSLIETGKVRLNVDRLAEIATVLNTTPAALLGDAPSEMSDEAVTPVAKRASQTDWRKFDPLDLDPVLSAALVEFVRVGYHGATIRQIAHRAGLSAPGIYHYYPSKQAILHALLHKTVEDLLWRTEAARAEGRDPVERFTQIIECLVLFNSYRRQLTFVGLSEMRSLESSNFQEIGTLRKAQQKMLDEEAAAAVASKRFTTSTPQAASMAVAAMCLYVSQWFGPNESKTPEQIATHYVRFSLDLMGSVDA